MGHMFGGAGFTGFPGTQCRLAGAPQQQPPAQPAPLPFLSGVPRVMGVPVGPEPVRMQAPPPPQAQAPAPAPYVYRPHPFGPQVYPVMKKGEAPCPVCH